MAFNQPYAPSSPTLLPLGEAVRGFPGQYLKVLSRPSVQSFSQEQGKATWGSTWLQLIALGLLNAGFSVLATLMAPPHLGTVPGVSPATLQIVTTTLLALFILIGTPLAFLVAGAVLYWLARLFKGDGSYLKVVYTLTLFGVPLGRCHGPAKNLPFLCRMKASFPLRRRPGSRSFFIKYPLYQFF